MEKEVRYRIEEARVRVGMSRAQLAEKVGVSNVAICYYEIGKRNPNAITLNKIAESLGCNIEDLLPTKRTSNYTPITFEELKQASLPLIELLRKKGHPHLTAVVTDRSTKIVIDDMGVPMPYED